MGYCLQEDQNLQVYELASATIKTMGSGADRNDLPTCASSDSRGTCHPRWKVQASESELQNGLYLGLDPSPSAKATVSAGTLIQPALRQGNGKTAESTGRFSRFLLGFGRLLILLEMA
jgi:hypothetical protein